MQDLDVETARRTEEERPGPMIFPGRLDVEAVCLEVGVQVRDEGGDAEPGKVSRSTASS
jgi:hypothetical protein